MWRIGLLAACAAVMLGSGAGAQEVERTHLKIVGEASPLLNYTALQQPFWEETIPNASGSQITADLVPFDQMGLDNATILRLLKQGVMDRQPWFRSLSCSASTASGLASSWWS